MSGLLISQRGHRHPLRPFEIDEQVRVRTTFEQATLVHLALGHDGDPGWVPMAAYYVDGEYVGAAMVEGSENVDLWLKPLLTPALSYAPVDTVVLTFGHWTMNADGAASGIAVVACRRDEPPLVVGMNYGLDDGEVLWDGPIEDEGQVADEGVLPGYVEWMYAHQRSAVPPMPHGPAFASVLHACAALGLAQVKPAWRYPL